jgi:dihydroorotate dehydrogenase (fumarate)
LELNLYSIPANPRWTGQDVETNYLETVTRVRAAVKIPVAVKLSPFFSNLANFAVQLDHTGIEAMVLFNRFYQPDIDLETLGVYPHLILSSSHDLRLPLRWVAILYGHVKADLAVTSGIHTGRDAVKALMAGASVTMMASALLRDGIDRIRVVQGEMQSWMEQNEYDSVVQMKGSVSQINCENPSEFERTQYMQALTSYLPPQYKPQH